MTTIANETVLPAHRRDARATLRRVASLAVGAATTLGAGLGRLVNATGGDGGQLGADYETEVGRWSGARI